MQSNLFACNQIYLHAIEFMEFCMNSNLWNFACIQIYGILHAIESMEFFTQSTLGNFVRNPILSILHAIECVEFRM